MASAVPTPGLDFPCSMFANPAMLLYPSKPALTSLRSLQVPFPTPRLANTALRALQVDPELSPLVRRDLSVPDATPDLLQVDYSATTNRMLRVSVNSFMDSLKLVVEVMEHMDEDVLLAKGTKRAASEVEKDQ